MAFGLVACKESESDADGNGQGEVTLPDKDIGNNNQNQGNGDKNQDGGDESQAPYYDGSPVTITFFNTMGSALRSVLDSAITRFNKLYPNVTVETTGSFTFDSLRDDILTRIPLKTQPNIAFCYADHVVQYNQSGAVLPLDGFLPDGAYKNKTVTNTEGTEPLGFTQAQANDFVGSFLAEGSAFEDGKLYTLPFAKATDVMYYNKTFFDKYNLTVPTTWTEMEEVCAKIVEIDGKCTPLACDSEANLFITLCQQFGSEYISATGEHYRFDNPKNREFVEMLKRWSDAGYFATQTTIGGFYTSSLFINKQCYMTICSAASAKNLLAYGDEFETGVAPIPQANKNNPQTIYQGPSVCIFKKADPKEVAASWLLVKFLTTEARFQAQYATYSGYLPVTKSAFNTEGYQEFLAQANLAPEVPARAALVCKQLADSNAFFTTPAFIGSDKAREQVGALVVSVLNGTKTVDLAFKDAIAECKR